MSHTDLVPSTLPALALRHRTIAVTSGKGGVGKSSLVLNVGLALARRQRQVAILDGDLGLASLTVLLGLCPRWDLRHVVAGERRLAEIVLRGPYGMSIIPAASGIAELASLPGSARLRLLAELQEFAEGVDFLLVDTGAGIGETVLDLVVSCDEAIVVTRPEPPALADAYALMKLVIQQDRSYPMHLVVNMARDQAEAEQVVRSLTQILQRFLGYQPGYAGWIVTDPSVGRAAVQQVPFTVLAPQSGAARAVEALVDRLLGESQPAPGARASFWARVAGLGPASP